MTDKPSRLLRCPLPEKWRKREILLSEAMRLTPKDLLDQCAAELEAENNRIEPLLVALVESGDAMAQVNYLGPGAVLVAYQTEWRKRKKAFLEGLK